MTSDTFTDDAGQGITRQPVQCSSCHRYLHDPISRALGKGPECRGFRGWTPPRWSLGQAAHSPDCCVCAGQGEIPGLEVGT